MSRWKNEICKDRRRPEPDFLVCQRCKDRICERRPKEIEPDDRPQNYRLPEEWWTIKGSPSAR